MPRASRGPKPKKGEREYFVVVRGVPPLPATEKPPPGIKYRAAHDLAFALSLQYGFAAVYTTEPRLKIRHKDPYNWPDWRWRLMRGYRAAWYTDAMGLGSPEMQHRPDSTGNLRRGPVPQPLPAPHMMDPTMERPLPPQPTYHMTMPSGWLPPGSYKK